MTLIAEFVFKNLLDAFYYLPLYRKLENRRIFSWLFINAILFNGSIGDYKNFIIDDVEKRKRQEQEWIEITKGTKL